MPTKVYGLNGFDESGAPIIGGTVTPQARPARGGMIMDEGGGSGGDSPIMDIKAVGTNADVINAALAQYLPLEVPQSETPQSINIDLQGQEFTGSYTFTATPGTDYFCTAGDVAPSGKGIPATFNVVASNNILSFVLMAATKEDGSDMIQWSVAIAGGGK